MDTGRAVYFVIGMACVFSGIFCAYSTPYGDAGKRELKSEHRGRQETQDR